MCVCYMCVYVYLYVCTLVCIHVHMWIYLPLYSLVEAKVNIGLIIFLYHTLPYFLITNFYYFVYMGIFVYVSVYHMCLVPSKVRKGVGSLRT